MDRIVLPDPGLVQRGAEREGDPRSQKPLYKEGLSDFVRHLSSNVSGN